MFWEDNKLYDQTGWNYKNVPTCTSDTGAGNTGCFTNIGTFPGTTVVNPGVQDDHTSFYQDTVRETKQTAFFASVDFDLIPKVLTLTAGTRHFKFDNSSAGSVLSSFGCFQGGVPAGGCQSGFSYNLNAQNLANSESGFKSRAQPYLAHHARHDGVLHVLAGLPPGRLQPERQLGPCLYARMARRSTSFRAPTRRTS